MSRSRAAELLEKITGIIPGISGYQERERRREDDKALRDQVARTVARCRQRISERMNEVSRARLKGGLGLIGRLEGVNVLLERIEDEIRYAPRGYAGWFDREGVDVEDLESLYEHDLILLETARRMEEVVPAGKPESGEEWLERLKEELDALTRVFEARSLAIRGEGSRP